MYEYSVLYCTVQYFDEDVIPLLLSCSLKTALLTVVGAHAQRVRCLGRDFPVARAPACVLASVRSPRPEEQFSPPSLSARVGSAIGGSDGRGGRGSGGGPGSREGYSSPSPSPRERRAHAGGGTWSEPEDQRNPRSSSQPRSMTQDRPLRPLSASNLRNRSTSVGTDCRRPGESNGGVGLAGDGDAPNGRRERTASSSQVDVFGGGVHKKSNGSDHANGARGSGPVSANSRVLDSNGLGPGHLSSHGRSGAAQSRCGVGHDHGHGQQFQQWDSRSRGRGLPAPVEACLSHDAEKLRREGAGRETILNHRRRRMVQERETDRAVVLARTRSNHLESVYSRSGGRFSLSVGLDEVRHVVAEFSWHTCHGRVEVRPVEQQNIRYSTVQ